MINLINGSSFRLKILILIYAFGGASAFAQSKAKLDFQKKLTLAEKIKTIDDPDSASSYARKLITEARKLNNRNWEAQVLFAEAYRYYKRGEIDHARTFAKQAANLATSQDSVTFIKAPLLEAYMLNRQGKGTEALKIAFLLMREAESRQWRELVIECKICIADVYRGIGEPKKGLYYATQAYNEAKNVKDTAIYIFATSTLSNLYSNKGNMSPENLKKSIQLYQSIIAEPYFQKLTDFTKARHLSNMGRLFEMNNDLQAAEDALIQSIEISKKAGYKDIEAHALNELMTVNIDQKQYREAIKYGTRAAELLADEKNINILNRNIYRNLTTAYLKLQDYEKAFNYNEKAFDINDSLVTIDKAEIATRLDEEYKADKRIIEANATARLAKQQRNFSIVIAVIIVLAGAIIYRWFVYRRKKQEDILAQEHLQLATLNNLKTKFFTNISHELRTPLTLIAGPIEQLKNEEYNLSAVEKKIYIETISLNSKKLLNLLNELLDLTKLENGDIPSKPKLTNIYHFVHAIFDGFSAAAQYKKVSYNLETAIHPNQMAILDREKIEKIVNNLINNALKFTPTEGHIWVQINLRQQWLQISVEDSGIGIMPDKLEKIFERYYQVMDDRMPAGGGTGIGLALAKELTESLGGIITAESTMKKGSTFYVSIPIELQNIDSSVDHSYATEMPNPEDDGHVKNSILLVEDQLEMANYISTILSPHHRIIFANNGVEALKILSQLLTMPCLIISDVMMPEMDGFELLENLKKHEIYCGIPVMLLTAITEKSSRNKALNIGVDDYLTKPFSSVELLTRTQNLIQNLQERLSTDVQFQPKEAAVPTKILPADLIWLKELESLIIANTGKTDLDIAFISYKMAVSERQLFRNIKRITGLTPNKYIRNVRLQLAREAIESGKYRTLSEIAYIAGFDTPAYFKKLFKEFYGKDVNDFF